MFKYGMSIVYVMGQSSIEYDLCLLTVFVVVVVIVVVIRIYSLSKRDITYNLIVIDSRLMSVQVSFILSLFHSLLLSVRSFRSYFFLLSLPSPFNWTADTHCSIVHPCIPGQSIPHCTCFF